MSVNNVLSAAECEALRDYCDARCVLSHFLLTRVLQ